MADKTKIEWTDATWNPVTGCSVVSPGCTNCYAMRLAGTRLRDHPSRKGLTVDSKAGPVWTGEVRFNEQWLDQPLRWKRPRMIFVCAHGDLFHEDVPDEWIDKVFAVMALCPQHVFQVLTKRPERMRAYLQVMPDVTLAQCSEARVGGQALKIAAARGEITEDPWWGAFWEWPLSNVWLGFSAEDQTRFDARWEHMKPIAAGGWLSWCSAEPLLGSLDISAALPIGAVEVAARVEQDVSDMFKRGGLRNAKDLKSGLDAQVENIVADVRRDRMARLRWVVCGGESGPGARPMHPDWARSIRDQCADAGVPFSFKQWGEWLPWEPEHGPCWVSQTGQSEDCHVLFPTDLNGEATWDDGIGYIDQECGHAAFQKVGKKVAGRHLDGVLHDAFPEAVT